LTVPIKFGVLIKFGFKLAVPVDGLITLLYLQINVLLPIYCIPVGRPKIRFRLNILTLLYQINLLACGLKLMITPLTCTCMGYLRVEVRSSGGSRRDKESKWDGHK
jgi:hypothetical protein